jgi:CheY-like chemotaxis protein
MVPVRPGSGRRGLAESSSPVRIVSKFWFWSLPGRSLKRISSLIRMWNQLASAEPTRSFRVLVVEDNADLASSMKRLLELDGHEPAVASTGVEAVEIARSFHPEVVLCDIGLPGGMNGYEVAEELRKDAELKSVFLIALTGYGRPEDRRSVIEAGFDMHMIKPVDPVLLARVLARRADGRVGDVGSSV